MKKLLMIALASTLLLSQAAFAGESTETADLSFVSAVLECLTGASADEVIADYMVTFFNYYRVQPGTEQYDIIANSNICKSLAAAFEIPDIREADLQAEAEAYLLEIGLTAEEIAQVRTNLGE